MTGIELDACTFMALETHIVNYTRRNVLCFMSSLFLASILSFPARVAAVEVFKGHSYPLFQGVPYTQDFLLLLFYPSA